MCWWIVSKFVGEVSKIWHGPTGIGPRNTPHLVQLIITWASPSPMVQVIWSKEYSDPPKGPYVSVNCLGPVANDWCISYWIISSLKSVSRYVSYCECIVTALLLDKQIKVNFQTYELSMELSAIFVEFVLFLVFKIEECKQFDNAWCGKIIP